MAKFERNPSRSFPEKRKTNSLFSVCLVKEDTFFDNVMLIGSTVWSISFPMTNVVCVCFFSSSSFLFYVFTLLMLQRKICHLRNLNID